MIALANMILDHQAYVPEEVQIAEQEAEREVEKAKDRTAGNAKSTGRQTKGKKGPSVEKKTADKEVLGDLAAAQKIMKAVLKSIGDSKLEYGSGWELCGRDQLKKIKF